MEYLLIIHSVNHCETWKVDFEGTQLLRKKTGDFECQIFQYENDQNPIVHFSKWQVHQKAKLFFEPLKVAEIRRKQGAKSSGFNFLNKAESSIL